jgi:hypothetical protein
MERETTASAAPCPTVSLGPHPLWIPLDYRGGELCRRDLRTDERRKSTQPVAERLGVDHRGFCANSSPSSKWNYEVARANVARWGVDAIPARSLTTRGTNVVC